MCVYIYVCMYICIYLYMYVYMCVYLIYIPYSVCVCVCVYVCHDCTQSDEKETQHIVYHWIQNLSSRVFVIISNPSNLSSGRYCPETGYD